MLKGRKADPKQIKAAKAGETKAWGIMIDASYGCIDAGLTGYGETRFPAKKVAARLMAAVQSEELKSRKSWAASELRKIKVKVSRYALSRQAYESETRSAFTAMAACIEALETGLTGVPAYARLALADVLAKRLAMYA